MFNLDEAIADWRVQMAAIGLGNTELLDELEAHLREDIVQMTISGAPEKTAFESAVKTLGFPETLRAEFAKVRQKEASPRFLRRSGYIFAVGVFLTNTCTLLIYEASPLERGLGIIAVSAICVYLVGRPRLFEFLKAASYGWPTKALKVGAGLLLLWPICALLEVSHVVHLGLGIVTSTVLWCLYGAFAMVAFTDALNSRRRWSSGGSLPPLQQRGQPIPPNRPQSPQVSKSLQQSRPLDPIVRQSLDIAVEEASRLGHNFVGTEHLLLGLMRLARGSFADFLQRMNLDPEAVSQEVEKLVSVTPIGARASSIGFTPRASKAVKLAAREARSLHHPGVAAEHVFLGLLLEGSGVAALVLRKFGLQVKRTRTEIFREAHANPES